MQVTVNDVVDATTKTGKPYQTVVFNNDQKASAWDGDFKPYKGQVIEVTIDENKGFKNIKLVPNYAKADQNPVAAPTNDIDIRKSSLVLVLEAVKVTGKVLTTEALITEVKWVENYLRNGFAAPKV